ncbi:MAG: hypothetical protein WBN44_01825 [Woeseiaceae bacterium]
MRCERPVVLLVLLTAAACGGGGGGASQSPPPPATPPAVTFISAVTGFVPENQIEAYTAVATARDTSATISYSISAGSDAGLFVIDSSTGVLSFLSSPDFENPRDVGRNNVYDVTLAANDGNGGLASRDVEISVGDVTNLALETTFPTPDSELGGDATQITVAGQLTDLEDGELLESDVLLIDVSGVSGTLARNYAGRWSAEVPISRPGRQMDITIRPATGADLTSSLLVTNQKEILQADKIAVDTANNRAFMGVFPRTLAAVDLATGLRTVASSDDVGSGPVLRELRSMAIDVANNRMFSHSDRQSFVIAVFYSIDLDTGDRQVISDSSIGTGPNINNTWDMEFDSANGRLLTVDLTTNAVYSVDIATGDRAVVSSPTRGNGVSFTSPTTLALDPSNNRVFVYDIDRLYAVALDSGDRTVLSVNYINDGPIVRTARDMIYDPTLNRVLVARSLPAAIIAIDLATGDRTYVSDISTGTGTPLEAPYSLAWESFPDSILSLDAQLQAMFRVSASTGDREIVTGNTVGEGSSPVDYNNIDITSTDIYVTELPISGGGALYRVDLATGNRSIVSDDSTGSGASLPTAFGVSVSEAMGKAFWFGGSSGVEFWVYSIDLASGDRELISDQTTGSGPAFVNLLNGDIDVARNRAIVIDRTLAGVYAVYIANGDRVEISGASEGSGPSLVAPLQLVLEPGNDNALVLDDSLKALVRVSLSNGTRTIVSSATVGGGVAFDGPRGVTINRSGTTAYVTDSFRVIAVNLENGFRSVVSSQGSGQGAELDPTGGLVYDAGRNRLFVSVIPVAGLIVIDIPSGDRAVFSR